MVLKYTTLRTKKTLLIRNEFQIPMLAPPSPSLPSPFAPPSPCPSFAESVDSGIGGYVFNGIPGTPANPGTYPAVYGRSGSVEEDLGGGTPPRHHQQAPRMFARNSRHFFHGSSSVPGGARQHFPGSGLPARVELETSAGDLTPWEDSASSKVELSRDETTTPFLDRLPNFHGSLNSFGGTFDGSRGEDDNVVERQLLRPVPSEGGISTMSLVIKKTDFFFKKKPQHDV